MKLNQLKMYLWFFLFYCLRMSTNVLSQCVDEPFDADNFYGYVSTKTDYEYVRGTLMGNRSHPECVPVQLWMVMRHGTRYASPEEVPALQHLKKVRDIILKNHKRNHGCLRQEKLDLLKRWKPSKTLHEKYASGISTEGKNQAERLGARTKIAFPQLVVNPNHRAHDSYRFRTTDHQRTIETLQAFIKGYFDDEKAYHPETTDEVETLIQPHKQCPAWDNHMEYCHAERDKFVDSPVFIRFAYALTARLGFDGKLTFSEIFIMYSMCRYEFAWFKKPSIWCMIFSYEEMRIMEYAEDLSYFYSCGPNCPLAGKLGCYAVTNMIQNFRKIENQIPRSYPKLVVYAGHTISINLLMMGLKTHPLLYPLKANEYESSEGRNYRSSLQSPFLANIMAVFHKCQGGSRGGTINKVMFYQNEKPLYLPYCGGHVCDWEVLKSKFSRLKCSRDCCIVL